MVLKNRIASHDAVAIIKDHGFIDTTPYISNVSHKIFIKHGQLYRFDRWRDIGQRIQDTEIVLTEINQSIIDRKINTIKCPGCGDILNNYNFFDDGLSKFVCQNCLYEITIKDQKK